MIYLKIVMQLLRNFTKQLLRNFFFFCADFFFGCAILCSSSLAFPIMLRNPYNISQNCEAVINRLRTTLVVEYTKDWAILRKYTALLRKYTALFQ